MCTSCRSELVCRAISFFGHMLQFIRIDLSLPKGHRDPRNGFGGGDSQQASRPLVPFETGTFALHINSNLSVCLVCNMHAVAFMPPDVNWGRCWESSTAPNIWKAPAALSFDSNTFNATCLLFTLLLASYKCILTPFTLPAAHYKCLLMPFPLPFSQSWVPFGALPEINHHDSICGVG